MFEIPFFLYCMKEWSKPNDKIRNIESINKFHKVTILNFISHLNFSHLNEHEFRHDINDKVDHMWSGTGDKTS